MARAAAVVLAAALVVTTGVGVALGVDHARDPRAGAHAPAPAAALRASPGPAPTSPSPRSATPRAPGPPVSSSPLPSLATPPPSATTTPGPPVGPLPERSDAGTDPGTDPGPGTVTDPAVAPTLPVGAPATLAPGVVATVRALTPVRTVVSSDGSSGPGVVVRLAVRNGSGSSLDLSTLAVDATAGGSPALPAPGGVAAPVGGRLDPGQQVSGTYVFAAATGGASRAPVLLRLGLPGSPAVSVASR